MRIMNLHRRRIGEKISRKTYGLARPRLRQPVFTAHDPELQDSPRKALPQAAGDDLGLIGLHLPDSDRNGLLLLLRRT